MNVRMAAVLVLLAAPGLALAETVPFTILAEGNFGPPGGRQQLVIRSQAELAASGLVDKLPASFAPIDWSAEMLIALKMGTQSSGGYSTRVVSIETGFITADPLGPLNPPAPVLNVTYAERSPTGAAISVITAPYQLVRLARHDVRTLFRLRPDRPFVEVSLTVAETELLGSFPFSNTVTVEAGGRVTVFRSHPAAFVVPITGEASGDELDHLSAAVRAARVGSLPNPLDVAVPMHLVHQPFSLQVEAAGDAQLGGHTSGQYRHYGQYEPQLQPLIAALEGIAERVRTAHATTTERRAISGVTRIVDGAPVIHEGALALTSQFVRTSGPAAEVLRRAEGRRVTCFAAVTSLNGVAQSAEIESVDGQARAWSRLTANPGGGAYRGYVLPGARVKILRLSGDALLVRVAGREGWLAASKIVIGESTATTATPGFTGAVPGQ